MNRCSIKCRLLIWQTSVTSLINLQNTTNVPIIPHHDNPFYSVLLSPNISRKGVISMTKKHSQLKITQTNCAKFISKLGRRRKTAYVQTRGNTFLKIGQRSNGLQSDPTSVNVLFQCIKSLIKELQTRPGHMRPSAGTHQEEPGARCAGIWFHSGSEDLRGPAAKRWRMQQAAEHFARRLQKLPDPSHVISANLLRRCWR